MERKQTMVKKIESIHHKDKRSNIPTEELRDFVAAEEHSPATLLYPRDPSLDPQLVWKGKDEQDRADLAVPCVPIYIQEKIHPQAIINDLVAQAARPGSGIKEAAGAYQIDLFADFNGGPQDFEKKVEFYQHEQNWANRMILGDSLLVMASLAEKEGLKGQVQMIYIDPPYGIKFGSNWQVSTRKRDVKDTKTEDITRQPEQVRAFRDTWKLGIHSYLAYLRDRLVLSRELLTDSGSIFVQIGDENVHLVRSLLDEVFGSENYCASIKFRRGGFQTSELLPEVGDHLLWYARQKKQVKFRRLHSSVEKRDAFPGQDLWITRNNGKNEKIKREFVDKEIGKIFRHRATYSATGSEGSKFGFKVDGIEFHPPTNRGWSTNQLGLERLKNAGRLLIIGKTLEFIMYHDDFPFSVYTNYWDDTVTSGFSGEKIYVVQTSTNVAKRCMLITTDPGDLVLDPTCGSGTTATVAEQWGRRWITIDTSRVALALARTRLMAAKYPYYLLADSAEGIQKETELTGITAAHSNPNNDIKKGFVYERVPHITLRSIANNPDIHEGMTRQQIDAAIARHAETETLYDKPYDDPKRLRVCGPFSVESLSPHRVLSSAAEGDASPLSEQEAQKQQNFIAMILENLKKAGVQNTQKKERLVFQRLEPFAGKWLQASGEYLDAEGKARRVAVCIGPEHGTVGPQLVKEAAKEAVQGLGFDVLIVCGFAFDPHVSEETKRYGSLTVLATKMNPDLAMGDDLLKKTGAGNLFMVFGEPDVDISVQKDGSLVVEVKGVDVYDPTTGQIRNSSTDDIACWFIDTDYNGESFFVRHAYFTGADEPYEKLKRALRAEVDEAAWSALYSTVSRPFARPESGKIAIKVINHYGDEVLKVFEV